jgi:hypothetical protein
MNKRMLAISAVSFVLTCILAALCLFHPVIGRDLNLSNVQHQRRFLYTINLDDLRAPPLYRLDYDSMNGNLSKLRLLENGRPIGIPHSPHDSIASDGGGRYSHWYTNLYFSSPDNTDPQLGNKRFAISIELSPSFSLVVAAVLSGAATLVFLSVGLIPLSRTREDWERIYSRGEPGLPSSYCHYTAKRAVNSIWVVGTVLSCTFFVLAFRLRQRDLEFLIQPDFNWRLIEAWRALLSTLDPHFLPVPRPDVYLDGELIVYAITDAGLRGLTNHIEFLRQFFPNDLSFAFGAALLANIVAYAAACVLFFTACDRLTGRLLIAALAAIGLFFTPQMLDINIGRVDFLNTLPLMIVFYCSCMLALGRETRLHAIALGAALAFAATIKVNGLFFGVFPALAALTSLRLERTAIIRLASFTALSLALFLLVFAVLMGRYLYYLSPVGLIENYIDSVARAKQWQWIESGPLLYYNFDLMLGSGLLFIALYFICFAYVFYITVYWRQRHALFLSMCFIGLSVAGMLTQKHLRGGYHLLPVFFAIIAVTAAAILDAPGNRIVKYFLVTIGGLAFVATLVTSISRYRVVVAERDLELIGIQDLKRAPRDWLRTHVAAGTTICIQSDSIWTLPPLDEFKVMYGPLALPYLDREALTQADPPSLAALENVCPIIITSDWHRALYDAELEKVSPATEAKWAAFFRALDRRYPPKLFSSAVPVIAKEVYVNDLRGH